MDLEKLAHFYHKDLVDKKPFGLWEYVKHDCGLPEWIIKKYWIGCDEKNNSISIPIYNKDLNIVDIKFRHLQGDQKYTHMKGGKPEIYGWDILLKEKSFVFNEGEKDCLVLRSKHIPSITVSGGAGTFNQEWAKYFEGKKVYFFFDNDEPGMKGVERVHGFIKDYIVLCKNITPGVLKEKEDATDYFIKYGMTVDNLKKEIKNSQVFSVREKNKSKETELPEYISEYITPAELKVLDTFDFIQDNVIVKRYGNPIMALCPFHKDKSPSFAIYNKEGANCFGCNVNLKGNIDFVMKLIGVDHNKAVKYLRNYFNLRSIKNNVSNDENKNTDTS